MSYKKNPNANPHASALGSIRSARKAASSRENGKKGGGRPVEQAVQTHDGKLLKRWYLHTADGRRLIAWATTRSEARNTRENVVRVSAAPSALNEQAVVDAFRAMLQPDRQDG